MEKNHINNNTSEPGPIPAIQELKVLTEDKDTSKSIGWTFKEYSGCEVHHYVEGCKDPDELPAITTKEGINVGDKLFIRALFGWCAPTLSEKISEGLYYAEDTCNIFSLEFDNDDRHCWVCPGAMNKKAIQKVKVRR